VARKRTTERTEVVEEMPDRLPTLPPDSSDIAGDRGESAAMQQRVDVEIDELLAEVGSTARVRIQRVNPDTGVPAHVGEIPSEGFSLETLADTFGGGRYHLRIFVGREQKGGRAIVEIDPTIPPRNPRAPKGVAAGAGGTVNDAMVGMMIRSAEMQQSMMTGFATAMTALVTAATQRPVADPVDQFSRMAEVLRPRETPGVSQFKELLELAELLGNREADPTLGLIGKGMEAVTEIVKRQPIPARIPAGNPATSVTPLPPANPPVAAVELRPWLQTLRPILPKLMPFIGGLDAATVADIVEQKLSPDAWTDLIADIVTDIPAGAALDNAAVEPFVRRTMPLLGIPADKEPWLTDLAREIITLENESGEESNDAP
jgi:hypothetical protein